MIKVIKENNLIKITGHAGAGQYGKDIVCASVSSIVYTTINAIGKLRDGFIKVKDDGKILEIAILKSDEIVKGLIDNMLELLLFLEKDYPKNLNVKEN